MALRKTLQQELEELEAKEAEAQLWAHMKQMRRQKAKNFSLSNSESIGRLLNNTGKEPEITGELFFRDKLTLKRVKTVKDPDLPYKSESQKVLDIFTR